MSELQIECVAASLNEELLIRECKVFVSYVAACTASTYVLDKYIHFHKEQQTRLDCSAPSERQLVSIAAKGVRWAKMADAYASVFQPMGLLKKKLVLCIAVLENSPGSHKMFTGGTNIGVRRSLFSIALSTLQFAVNLMAGVILISPQLLPVTRGKKLIPK